MTTGFALPRKLIVFGVLAPLAVLLGYVLAVPMQYSTMAFMAVVVFALTLPLWLRWYHPILILGWNAAVIVILLPGQPPLWMLLVAISLGVALLNLAMDKQNAFIRVPALTWPLFFLVGVVLVTAKFTGGISLHSVGASRAMGGRWYFYLLLAIAGYFALTSRRIPPHRATLYASLFFLAGTTSVVSNLAYSLGPRFYFLFYFFPTDLVGYQVAADYSVGLEVIERLTGVAYAALFALGFMLMRYGIQGILDTSKPWRLMCFIGILFASMFGGFRGVLVMFSLTLAIQFCLEGLIRTRVFFVLFLTCLVSGVLLVPFARHLPRAAQRSLTFLPLNLDPVARMDARNSLDWRLEMWQILSPEVPRYLLLGKGYAVNATDMYLAVFAQKRGYMRSNEANIVFGNYHNGPLSVLIPFGLWGAIAFLWLVIASIWALWRNYRFGDPALKNINTLLFSYFIMRILFFLLFFGAFASELYVYTGIVGLSVSLNAGVRKASDLAAPLPEPAPPAA